MGTCGQFEPGRSHPLPSHLLLALLVTIHHSSFIIHDLTLSVERSGWKSGSTNESESETNRQGYTFGTAEAISTGFTFSCNKDRMESGYLDNTLTKGDKRKLAPTTLFAQLAQRQFDHQQTHPPQQIGSRTNMKQEEYDHPSSWSTPNDDDEEKNHHIHTATRSRTRERATRVASKRDQSESSDSSELTDDSLALQREWEEQVLQMKLMFQIIIFPFVGKFFGRKFGYFCKYPPTRFQRGDETLIRPTRHLVRAVQCSIDTKP